MVTIYPERGGLGAQGCGWVYVGSNIPSSGSYIGQLIQVDNPAVPSGRSILRWGGTIWAPPRGEMIACKWGTTSSPIVSVTPGVTTLTEVYGASGGLSPAIPDYMLPDSLVMDVEGWISSQNNVQGGPILLGITISGQVPVGTSTYDYPLSGNQPAGMYYSGASFGLVGKINRKGGLFGCADSVAMSNGSLGANMAGIFLSETNRVYAMAKPSQTTDLIRLDGYTFSSMGNL